MLLCSYHVRWQSASRVVLVPPSIPWAKLCHIMCSNGIPSEQTSLHHEQLYLQHLFLRGSLLHRCLQNQTQIGPPHLGKVINVGCFVPVRVPLSFKNSLSSSNSWLVASKASSASADSILAEREQVPNSQTNRCDWPISSCAPARTALNETFRHRGQ